jgi:hypothetical protein
MMRSCDELPSLHAGRYISQNAGTALEADRIYMAATKLMMISFITA